MPAPWTPAGCPVGCPCSPAAMKTRRQRLGQLLGLGAAGSQQHDFRWLRWLRVTKARAAAASRAATPWGRAAIAVRTLTWRLSPRRTPIRRRWCAHGERGFATEEKDEEEEEKKKEQKERKMKMMMVRRWTSNEEAQARHRTHTRGPSVRALSACSLTCWASVVRASAAAARRP